MTDRELLERAAKAAGVEGKYMEVWGDAGIAPDRPDGGLWNPLEDDADALRLAVKLRLSPEFDGMEVYVSTGADTDYTASENAAEHALDWFAATRRAIVRAAAAIGGHPA